MSVNAFSHVTTWVFDLDNTLYPPGTRLFDQIEGRMVEWITVHLDIPRSEANRLRHHYWRRYGTTLAGLMTEHGIDPSGYLAHVHAIDMSALIPDPRLARALAALPGRRIVYTNADCAYAARVLEARGIAGLFDAVYGIEEADFRPKPESRAFERVFARDGLNPAQAAMFEDDPRNLAVPHALGMETVLVTPEPLTAGHIGHHTDDLAGFLALLGIRGRP